MQLQPNGEPKEVDFLVFSLEMVNDRIAQLDNKASVMLGLLAAMAVAVNVAVPFGDLSDRNRLLGLGIICAYLGIAVVAFLALFVIRPSLRLSQPTDTSLWLAPGHKRTLRPTDHLFLVHGSDEDRPRLEALRESHRKLLLMVANKFWWYHRMAVGMKVLVVYLAVLGAVTIGVEIIS